MKAIRNNLIETGVVETLQILKKYTSDPDLFDECSLYCPIPFEDTEIELNKIVEGLYSMNKEKLLFLTPEKAIIEQLATKENPPRIIVPLPNGLQPEVVECIKGNMPDGIPVTFISENGSPSDITSSNAAIVAFGFADGDRSLIPDYNYRMMEHYKMFYGLRVLVSCASFLSSARPIGWAPVNTCNFFNVVI